LPFDIVSATAKAGARFPKSWDDDVPIVNVAKVPEELGSATVVSLVSGCVVSWQSCSQLAFSRA
jgi:hypothetical protein